MTQPKVCGRITTNWTPMSYKIAAVFLAAIAAVPVWAEAQKGSLANLIQQGNRKAALAQIRAGADVN